MIFCCVAFIFGSAMVRHVPSPVADGGGCRVGVRNLKVQHARTGFLARLAAADDTINIVAQLKGKLDLHVGLALMHQFIVALRARPAPQRPRDRVKDGGFARAVIARQAADVNAAEVQLGIAVVHEVSEFEIKRNHSNEQLAMSN